MLTPQDPTFKKHIFDAGLAFVIVLIHLVKMQLTVSRVTFGGQPMVLL